MGRIQQESLQVDLLARRRNGNFHNRQLWFSSFTDTKLPMLEMRNVETLVVVEEEKDEETMPGGSWKNKSDSNRKWKKMMQSSLIKIEPGNENLGPMKSWGRSYSLRDCGSHLTKSNLSSRWKIISGSWRCWSESGSDTKRTHKNFGREWSEPFFLCYRFSYSHYTMQSTRLHVFIL